MKFYGLAALFMVLFLMFFYQKSLENSASKLTSDFLETFCKETEYYSIEPEKLVLHRVYKCSDEIARNQK